MTYKEVHVKRLKEFITHEQHEDPRQVANRDKGFWDIKMIHSHMGTAKKRSDMKFKVEWVGWPDSKDFTFEPLKNIRNTRPLHDYLRLNGLQSLIPQKFKQGVQL